MIICPSLFFFSDSCCCCCWMFETVCAKRPMLEAVCMFYILENCTPKFRYALPIFRYLPFIIFCNYHLSSFVFVKKNRCVHVFQNSRLKFYYKNIIVLQNAHMPFALWIWAPLSGCWWPTLFNPLSLADWLIHWLSCSAQGAFLYLEIFRKLAAACERI